MSEEKIKEILNRPQLQLETLIKNEKSQKIEELKNSRLIINFCNQIIEKYYQSINVYKKSFLLPFIPNDIEIYETLLLEIFNQKKQFEGYNWKISIGKNRAIQKAQNIYSIVPPLYGVDIQLVQNQKQQTDKTLNLKK